MEKLLPVMLMILQVIWSVPPAALAAGYSVTVTADDTNRLESCDQIEFLFNDKQGVQNEVLLPVAPEPPRRLAVRAPIQTSVRLQSHKRNDLSVRVCRAARAGYRWGKLLDSIAVTFSGDVISVRGPKGNHWWVFLIIDVPKDWQLDVRIGDGEFGLYEFTGQLDASTTSGPLWLRRSSGKLQLRTEDGLARVDECGGEIEVRTRNGPVEITLRGQEWGGAGLRARTHNGLLRLTMPDSYSSSIRLEISSHADVQCEVGACQAAVRTWNDRSRQIQFGAGPPVVWLSTYWGPVVIVPKD